MIEKINFEAFELIKLVSSKPIEISNQNKELKGSLKEKGFTDWSGKIVSSSGGKTDYSFNKIELFASENEVECGFDELCYPKFRLLVEEISSLMEFESIISEEFVEKKSFKWILDVYKTQKASTNLIDYLRSETEKNISVYQFYFPILNLTIDENFKIGNVELMYFTKDYFDNYYTTLKEGNLSIDEVSFEIKYRKDFQGQVLAKVTVNAEQKKAELIAMTEAELAVDVLKIYGLTPQIPELKTMFELKYRLNYSISSNFLFNKIGEIENLTPKHKFNNYPFYFSKQNIVHSDQNGLQVFSKYITLKNDDELYVLIIQAIHLFGSALSNWDLHLRSINLITILESLLLKNEEETKMANHVKARLSKIISNDFKEKESLKELFEKLYQSRHKMIHKAKRIPIDLNELSQAQIIIINLLIKLIDYNIIKNYKDKGTLIEVIDKIKS